MSEGVPLDKLTFTRLIKAGVISSKVKIASCSDTSIQGQNADIAIIDEVEEHGPVRAFELKAIEVSPNFAVEPKVKKPYFRQKERW